MPNSLLSKARSSWTVQLNPAVVRANSTGDVVITVENLASGNRYSCTTANGKARISSSFLNFVQPSDATGSYYTDPYKVTVTGLYDQASGKEAVITYTVRFFTYKTISSFSIPRTLYAYTGGAIEPAVEAKYNGTTLTEGIDYEVTYYNNVEEGTAVVEVAGIGNYCGVSKKTFRIEKDRKDMSQCTISLNPSYFTYTGEEQEPEVTVTSFGNTLVQGQDYEVVYSDNIEPGTATVTVNGIGQYSGTASKTFTIYKASNQLRVSFSSREIEVGGTAVLTASAVFEDATVTFESLNEDIATIDEDGTIHALAEGTARIRVRVAETEHYSSGYLTYSITASKDYHTMDETILSYADGDNNTVTVFRKCSVCGKEETSTFTTISKINYVYYWTGYHGYTYLSSNAYENDTHEVSLGSCTPSDAEDKTIVLESSDPEIMKVDGLNFTFLKTGSVTLTIYAKYNPSVKITKTFTVSHLYDEGQVEEVSTCATHGKKIYTCERCGATMTEDLPLDLENHTGETYLANQLEETCGADGYTGDLCCKGCDKVFEVGSVIPATGKHIYDEGTVTKEASCAEEGIMLYTCTVCEDSYTQAIPKTDNHVWNEEVTLDKAATCTEDGMESIHCSLCGAVKEDSIHVIPALGHKNGDPEYTWTEDYLSVTARVICQNDPLHILAEETVDTDVEQTESTCTDFGNIHYTATFTNELFEEQVKDIVIDAKGHTPDDAVLENEKEATCTEDGSYDMVVYCKVCGAQINCEHTVVPAKKHVPGEAVVENEIKPTTTEEGSYDEVIYCTVCKEELLRTTVIVPKIVIPVEKIALNRSSAEAATKSNLQLEVIFTPSDTTQTGITWSSSNPAVATVDENGKVTALTRGVVTITAASVEDSSMQASCEITVKYNDAYYNLDGTGRSNVTKEMETAINWAADHKITGEKESFGTMNSMTRGQFVRFLYRYAGNPKVTSTMIKKYGSQFTDVDNGYTHYKAIVWAVSKGLIGGYDDGTFKPEKSLSRNNVATILWKYAGSPKVKNANNPFSDVAKSAAIAWGKSKKIFTGTKFMPKANCLRGDFALFLYRYNKNIGQ